MKSDIQFGNYTDNVLCSYVTNCWLIACVHPVIHLALYRMLKDGSEATKAEIRTIVEQRWFPGVFTNNIETGQSEMKAKLEALLGEDRLNVLRYSQDSRFEDVGGFPLDYLEERFNARTPEFKTFRGFYVHLKHTDPAWLYADEDGEPSPPVNPAFPKAQVAP